MENRVVVCFVIVLQFAICIGQKFAIPPVTIETYKPKGFKASIPDVPGIRRFAFHGKLNQQIEHAGPGEFRGDVSTPTNGVWVYKNSNAELAVGDTIYYWVFVQHNQFGYRVDDQAYTVTELLSEPTENICTPSKTVVSGRNNQICSGETIFQDDFNGDIIDKTKWKVDHMIPADNSSYEFVSYQNNQEVIYLNEGDLNIKLKPLQSENDVRGQLDLREGCTGKNSECTATQIYHQILPPVVSARIKSLFKFTYGKIEIKAKLPSGDWIYPQVKLISDENPRQQIWIAYARGNKELTGDAGDDIGGRILFGGLVQSPQEPERSKLLRNIRKEEPLTEDSHLYSIIWTPETLTLFLDGTNYGTISLKEYNFDENKFYVCIGVGVGGIHDFPDGYKSGNNEKPWKNGGAKSKRDFFDSRNKWLPSWKTPNGIMQVDWIKISAL